MQRIAMLDAAERWVRRFAALAGLALVASGYLGWFRGTNRPRACVVGPLPLGIRISMGVMILSSSLLFGPFYLLWRPFRPRLSSPARAAVLAAGSLLFFPGMALALWGRLILVELYDTSTILSAQLYAGHRLVTSGPFSLVRHPMYLGIQLAALGSVLIYRTWSTLLLVVMFRLVRNRFCGSPESVSWAALDDRISYSQAANERFGLSPCG